PGGTYSNAAGINSLGHVVGYADPEASQPYQPYHAFLFDGISLQDIGTLGGDQSSAADINNNGKITGFASLADSLSLPHAFIYDGSTMKDIGTLGGVGSGSLGTAINANGHVTGAAGYDDFFLQHAFFYDGTSMRDLGSLSIENNSSIGKDINDHDQIVGHSFTSYGAQHAFIYDPKCGMVDLNSLIDPSSGWIIEEANAINNKGQITGFGRYENGDQRAFILTPVPELSSLCFVSIGFILIAYPIARRARS
ncbi:DUF3466 family protein, partial [bacterium]|nr:DUF3466 family protein [bacterium]